MTAKNKIPASPTLWPRRAIYLPAFFGALILAPIIVGIIGAPVFLISVAALIFGAPLYLIFGAPILFWLLSRNVRRKAVYAFAGLMTNTAIGIAIMVFNTDSPELGNLYLLFGSAFAPIWAATFAALYASFTKKSDIYA